MSTTEEMIKNMYESQLKSQKEQLDTDYKQAVLGLDAQQKKNQQITDVNLNRTAVEAQKAAVNNAELHNAYGLSSGARAQARLAQENQLQSDMTALRAAQQNADADVERQRSLLAQEYASAIRQAQAENDLAKAEALYAAAKEEENKLLAKQEAAGKLMAEVTGDYSLLGKLYGLSDEEIAALAGGSRQTESPVAQPTDNVIDAVQNAVNNALGAIFGITGEPIPPTEPKAPTEPTVTPDVYKDTVIEVTRPGGNQTIEAVKEEAEAENPENYADLPIDEASVVALGFGPITAETLEKLIADGVVEEYVEDGYIKYRRKKVTNTSAALNPWRR